MDNSLQNSAIHDEKARKNFIDMLKALFGMKGKGQPTINTVKAKEKDIDNMVHNIGVASKAIELRAKDFDENGEHFKALLLQTRVEQMNEMAEAFKDPVNRKEGVRLNFDDMAQELQLKVEAKIDKIQDTDLFNKAQADFARFKLDPNQRLNLDQDILKSSFSDRNPADAAFVKYLNSSTEAFCKQNIKDIRPAAAENDLSIENEKKFDRAGIEAQKTDPKVAAAERAAKGGRPDTIPSKDGGFDDVYKNDGPKQ